MSAIRRRAQALLDAGVPPLWQRLRTLLTPEPDVASIPRLWHYDGLRDLLLESADLISADEVNTSANFVGSSSSAATATGSSSSNESSTQEAP